MSDSQFTLVIKTKLAPPRVGGALVRREQILAALEARRDDALTLILGPAGSGKTILCALWRQQLATSGCDVAWYNLGPDDDEAQFAAYVAASFQSIGLPIAADAFGLYNRSGGKSFDAFLAVLVNDLHRHARPLYLVLEDFHCVRSPAIVNFIDRLTALAPPNFHLVISSRVRPPLDLVPLRVKDQLGEISFAELRFTLDESVHFLRNQRIDHLSATQVHTLHQLTDGWAAGLQLAAFSLRKTRDPETYLQRFAETLTPSRESSLRDYLRECIADHLPEEELAFLIRTSACRRFNRELCEQITGNACAGELLAKFEAENLFLIPIDFDDRLPWYRFHRLLAAFLNERLQQLPSDELKQINRCASQWFAGKGLYAEAIRHASEAGDEGLCVELVDRAARPTLNSAHLLQLLKWFAQVPRELAKDRYELLRCVAWAQVVCGAMDDFEWSIAALEAHPQVHKPDARLEVRLLKAFKLMRLDDTAAVLKLLAPYLDDPPQARPFALMLLCNLLALALVAANQFERARDLVRDRPRRVSHEEPHHPAPFVDAAIGVSFLVQGDIWQAKLALLKTMDEARSLGADPAGYVACYLAEAHYELDELALAEALLAEYADVIEVVGTADSVLHAYRVRAKLCLARGRTDAALAVLDRMEEFARRQGLDRVLASSLAIRTQLEIERRQLPAAREALRRLQAIAERHRDQRNCADADIPFAHTVAEAELAVATDQPELARKLLEPLIAECDMQGRRYDATMLRVRAAVALMNLAQASAAMQVLRQALAVASEHGMVRVFLDAGEAVTLLLHDLLKRGGLGEREAAFAESTLHRRAPEPDRVEPIAPDAPVNPPRPTDALSPRELEILGLLAKAFSTKSIARVLNVSAGTVKWHLKHVYGKLGAASREQAVVKARNMRLID